MFKRLVDREESKMHVVAGLESGRWSLNGRGSIFCLLRFYTSGLALLFADGNLLVFSSDLAGTYAAVPVGVTVVRKAL